MSEKIVVRQPPEFKLNSEQDFATWYARFSNFAAAVKIEAPNQFQALVSYLDSSAFTIVQNLGLDDEQIKDPTVFRPLIATALKGKDGIPARLALKYRVQNPTETLSDYAMALGKLATKASISAASREETLVDTFCTGVSDTDLSVKLLENTFDTLSLALEQAQKIEGATNIRKLVRPTSTSMSDNVEILATNANNGYSKGFTASRPGRQASNIGANFPSDRVTAANHNRPYELSPAAPNYQPNQFAHFAPHGNNARQYTPNNSSYPNMQHPGNGQPNSGYPVPNMQHPENSQSNSGYPVPNMQNPGNGQSDPGQRKREVRCWHCDKTGHKKSNCIKRLKELEAQTLTTGQNFQATPGPRQ